MEGDDTGLREEQKQSWTFPTEAARSQFMRQSATDMGLAEKQLYDAAVTAEQKVRDRAEKDQTYNLNLSKALIDLERNIRATVLPSKQEEAIAQGRRRFFQQLSGELDSEGRAIDSADSQGLGNTTGANLQGWNK